MDRNPHTASRHARRCIRGGSQPPRGTGQSAKGITHPESDIGAREVPRSLCPHGFFPNRDDRRILRNRYAGQPHSRNGNDHCKTPPSAMSAVRPTTRGWFSVDTPSRDLFSSRQPRAGPRMGAPAVLCPRSDGPASTVGSPAPGLWPQTADAGRPNAACRVKYARCRRPCLMISDTTCWRPDRMHSRSHYGHSDRV